MKNTIYDAMDLIKKYRWNSIFFQYLRQIFCIIMLPFFIISMVIFANHTKSANREIFANYQNSVSKTSNAIGNILKEVENYYLMFSTNPYISLYINFETPYIQSTHQSFNYQRMSELMNYCKLSSLYIDSIYVYNEKSDYVFSSKNSNDYEDFYDKDALSPFLAGEQLRYIKRSQNSNTLVFGFKLFGSSGNSGVVCINLDPDKLREYLASNNNREAFFLLDENQNILFSSVADVEAGAALPEPYCAETFSSASGKVVKNGNSLFYGEQLSNGLSFWAVGSSEHYKTNLQNTALYISVLILLALLIPLAVSLYASMRFYQAIADIAASLQTEPYASTESNFDEISFINQNIISMIKAQNHVEEELVEKINTLKVAQTVALQTQINPHFLFNTLNLVNVIVMQNLKKENDAEKVISYLAEMLRGTLSTGEFITDVEQELHNTKLYVEIERIKYKNNFEIEWDIDDTVNHLKTAKIILQPIVENAFEHGIRSLRDKKGKIQIRAYTTEQNLIFSVHDNGVGMSAARLKEVRARLETGNLHDSKHIGLYNVNQRIKLIFGNQYGACISSEEGSTTVTISLPIVTEEQN